jgi:hypothetical protein
VAIAGNGCSSKDDISKEDSDQARQWSRNKTIGNKAYRYRIERISGPSFTAPLSKMLLTVTNSLHLFLADYSLAF